MDPRRARQARPQDTDVACPRLVKYRQESPGYARERRNLFLEYLRAIRGDVTALRDDSREAKSRLTSLETASRNDASCFLAAWCCFSLRIISIPSTSYAKETTKIPLGSPSRLT